LLLALALLGNALAQVEPDETGGITDMQEQPAEEVMGEPSMPEPQFSVEPSSRITELDAFEGTAKNTTPGVIEPGLQPLIDLVMQDLATQQLTSSTTDIEVLEARGMVWPDRGLGCPRPGMIYIQVPVDGALIRVRVGATVYEYHSAEGRPPFLCVNPSGTGD
jgi:hypothetical protein